MCSLSTKNITRQSIASPRTPHLSMIPLVTFTFALWPPKSIEFTMVSMSGKFEQEHTTVKSVFGSQLISIRVHWDIDLWPPKSIGSILSPGLTSLICLMKNYTTVKSLSCPKAYLHICTLWPCPLTFKNDRVHPLTMVYMHAKFDKEINNGLVSICSQAYFHICPLWPRTLTPKINRVHPHTKTNTSAKFDQEAHNDLVAIVSTSLFLYMSVVTLTFDLQNQ